jgi:HD superfamily phosphohydrolase
LYLQSLLRDPYEPLFAQLVTEEDLRRLLLAALVHDLGHYPLAHELEDVAPPGLRDCFDHEKLTIEWLKSESRDSEGSTLKAIISDKGGWNVDCGKLISLLQRQGLFLSAKDRLLRSVFDGPVDVDKLDYLVRDSRRCELPYGSAIDVERLVRSLTVLWRSGSVVSLAVYEKGQSAAESVAFARYQMYQAVYWHHTIRAVRPMLREVLRGIERRIGADFKRNKKRKRKTAADFEKAFRNFLGFDNGRREIGLDDVLLFLKGHTDDVGRELVDLIRSRRFYKRVLTIHHYEPPGGQQSLCQQFQARGSNGELDEPLQSEIRDRFSDFLKRHQGPMPTVLAGEKQQDRILDELRKPGRILTDCPRPRIGSDQTLWFVLEPKRLLQSYTSRLRQAERVSELWNDVYSRLMGIASKARVYCHPEIRDGLMASVGPDGIRDAVEKLLENSW